jgi:hypothetical protein
MMHSSSQQPDYLAAGKPFWCSMGTFPQDAQKGRPARPQPMKALEAQPLGYVEDAFEARTPLAGFFSILLVGRRCGGNELERR